MGRPRKIIDPESEVGDDIETRATKVIVKDSRGQTIRTYSLAVHGENFEELAKMFHSHTPTSTLQVL